MLLVMEKPRSHCPIAFALDVFGDRWSLLILRDIIFKGKRHYSEFIASDEKIATNILASRLESLEEAGLIVQSGDEKDRKKIIYQPTKKALDLIPVMLEMVLWSASCDSNTAAPRSFVKRAKTDRNRLIEEIRKVFETE